MNIIQENIPVNMIRQHLKDIPNYILPAGYRFRWYQPGDEQWWVDIHQEAEKYAETSHAVYQREFNNNLEALKQRQCFIMDAEEHAIGTASAWFNPDYNGQAYGRVHWVAIIPRMQGKGLSKPLMTAVCQRMRELGHGQAYLSTSTARIPAINLYLKFGFVPEIRNEDDRRAWQGVQKELGTNF